MKYEFEINSGEILNRSILIFEDRFTTTASNFFLSKYPLQVHEIQINKLILIFKVSKQLA